MSLHDGLLLLGGVVLLYLYDSALLLYHNEIVVIGRCRDYCVSAGSGFELGGRHVFLPQPFCPHQSLFRLSWPQQGELASGSQAIRMRRVRVALALIAPWTWLLFVLFAAGLPYVLFVSGHLEVLLAWVATVYGVILATLALVYRLRKVLNLSGRDVAAIAMDALLCAPFALNIIRKIGLRQRFQVDLRKVASTMLPSPAVHALTTILRQRIQVSLGFVEPDQAASHNLTTYLAYFERLDA